MPDYQKGKISKIWDNNYTECYIGSTIQELCMRMAGHRKHYDLYKKKERNFITVFKLFDKYGLNNCRIELEETFPCDNKDQLLAREGEYVRNTDYCINKQINGRTFNQWYEDNKEQLQEKQKQYYTEHKKVLQDKNKEYRNLNKEHIKQQQKVYRQENKQALEQYQNQYRETNKDILREKNKKYAQENKELIKPKHQEPYICSCGSVICKGKKSRHNKSLKHQKCLKSLSQEERDETL